MKVGVNLKNTLATGPSFGGFEHKKNNRGVESYKFNYPYDEKNYDAYIEFYKLAEVENGKSFAPTNQIKSIMSDDGTIKLSPKGVNVNPAVDLGIEKDEPFGYRYKLVYKGNDQSKLKTPVSYAYESGLTANLKGNEKINIYVPTGAPIRKGGSMMLAIPDSFNVGFVYEDGKPVEDKKIKEKAIKANKTFSNKLGGTLAGVEAKLADLKKTGYTRMLMTPIFTDDSLSAHGYWIKNPYQMIQSAGTIENYESLAKNMFKAGINLVADGAFVNEGLEGVHFKDVLKNGKESPYYQWFRFSGIDAGPLSFGVFSKNQEFIDHRVVNSPFIYSQDADGVVKAKKNPNYDGKKPTYVQIFDKRLVSKEQLEDTSKLIKSYEKLDTGNLYDINNHNDTVIPYSFEIRPDSYDKNIQDFNEMNKDRKGKLNPIPLSSPLAARILAKSDSYQLDDKFENRFETWDANTDIAKLNYLMSDADIKAMKNISKEERAELIEMLERRNIEMQDFAITAAKYWTQKTKDFQLLGAAGELKKLGNNSEHIYKQVIKLANEGKLPESIKDDINPQMIKNALHMNYPLNRTKRVKDVDYLLMSGLMDLPLESIELGDDVSAVLGYPQLSKRAFNRNEVGVSRYLMYQNTNPHLHKDYEDIAYRLQDVYTNELSKFATGVIESLDNKLDKDNKIMDKYNATMFGAYVLPIIGQDIAKFAMIKALYPKAEIKFDGDKIIYDYESLKKVSLKDIGVDALTPEDQANQMVSRMKSGLKNLSDKDKQNLSEVLYNKIKDMNANSMLISELIIDRTQSGLDWRIDATKDIADTDSLRNSHTRFDEYWETMTDFWSLFTSRVREENPNSYFTAEMTDEWGLMEGHDKLGNTGIYKEGTDAVNKFLQQTGIQTTPNYNYFFSSLLLAVSKSFEEGKSLDAAGRNRRVYSILEGDSTDGFDERHYLNSANLDSLLYSYTFAGNHDKPRALHCLALDMELFHTNFKYDKKFRDVAARVLGENVNHIDYDYISGKSIAMADVVKNAFDKSVGNDKDRSIINLAIRDLAKGSYLGKNFSAESFGVKPFDQTIDAVFKQAEFRGLKLSDSEKEKLFNQVFDIMLKPAMTKMETLMNYLVLLPGNPTLFAGDDLGLTGYDEKCKNVYLQSRSMLHWEWLSDDKKAFIKDYSERINNIMKLRSDKRLSALNNGAPFVLKPQQSSNKPEIKIAGLLRQNADGAMVLSLMNSSGTTLDNKAPISKEPIKFHNISLAQGENAHDGVAGGLTVGTVFKNIDESDKGIYKVVIDPNTNAYVVNRFNKRGEYEAIEIKDSTFVLYAEPNQNENKSENHASEISMKGTRVLYNPQYRFISSPYQVVQKPQLGQKLLLR